MRRSRALPAASHGDGLSERHLLGATLHTLDTPALEYLHDTANSSRADFYAADQQQ